MTDADMSHGDHSFLNSFLKLFLIIKPLIIMNALLKVKDSHGGRKMINKMDIRHKIIIMSIVSVIISIILFWKTAAYPSTLEQAKENIVAEINGESLTYEELLKQYNLFLVISGYAEQFREKITLESYLDRYISSILLIQEANKMGIRAAGLDEVRRQKEIYFSITGQTEDTLSMNLYKAGFSMEDADRYFEKGFIINTMRDMKFGDIEISDEEAREYYSGNPGHFNVPDKISVSHILICHRDGQGCKSKLNRQEAKKSAENIRNIATPEKFAELAKQYSMDTITAADGGNLGDISKGMAAKAFEDAAFKLNIGEISDPVETDFGFHIIYVTDKKGALITTFEEARESIKENLKNERIRSILDSYAEDVRKKADIKIYPIVSDKAINDKEAGVQKSPVTGNSLAPERKFQTFNNTGRTICKNNAGLPIIILFTSSRCTHCIWVGETFDSTVMEYVDNGLIEAHHYDLDTKDDLLTAAVETKIPQGHLDIDQYRNPEGFVPYFNFGCKYDRIGTGYEKLDDLASETREFRQVIDSLLSEERHN